MTQYFLDTSALVKRYIHETGTAWVQQLHDPQSGHTRWVVQLAAVEGVAAVFRRVRMGQLALADAQSIRAQFTVDIVTDYLLVDVTPTLITRAMALAEHYMNSAYDAVQLAAADIVNAQVVDIGHRPITFVSADNALNDAALQVGLLVENPNNY